MQRLGAAAWALAGAVPESKPVAPKSATSRSPEIHTDRERHSRHLGEGGVSIYPKVRPVDPDTGVPLRQAHERPAKITIRKDGPGSWWVGLDRDQLRAHIARRQEQMQASRQARFVDGGVRE